MKRKFLITVDHYSDFFEVNILKDLTPESVIAVCKENFARHGIPQVVLSDNGTNFVNHKMIQFASDWGFQQTTSAPHHQQSNGKSEAAVKIAKRLLKKAEESGSEFWYALLHWRNIPNKIGSSPVARLFARSTRCGIPTSANRLLPKVVENVPSAIENQRKHNKKHYDRKVRYLPELKVGSPVYIQLEPASSKTWTPGTVCNRLSERSYLVDVEGNKYRRSRVHVKPREEQIPSPSSEGSSGEIQNKGQGDNPSTGEDAGVTFQNIPFDESHAVINSDDFLAVSSTPPRIIPSTGYERPRRDIRRPARLVDYQLE